MAYVRHCKHGSHHELKGGEMKNIKFQIALVEAGMNQRDLAKATGVNAALISLAARGRYVFSDSQKEKISKFLRKPAAELFPNY